MTPEQLIRDVVRKIEQVTQHTARWSQGRAQINCPAHRDDTASLSVFLGDKGCVILKCHAGCSNEDVLKAAGLEWKDLFSDGDRSKDNSPQRTGRTGRTEGTDEGKLGRIVEAYDYLDAQGRLLYQVVRFEPKDFRQRRPDPKREGQWVWNLQGVPRVLYRLPELIAADRSAWVFAVEGEKDADSLAGLGLVATTCPLGAGKWDSLSSDSILEGRRVAILPDRDAPNPRRPKESPAGEKHLHQVGRALAGRAAEIKALYMPDGLKDVSDWIARAREPGEDRPGLADVEIAADLLRLVENAPRYAPPAVSVPVVERKSASPKNAPRDVAALTTDVGNAARFVKTHGQDVRYCGTHSMWYVWDESRWRPDHKLAVMKLAKKVALNIFDEAKAAESDTQREKLGKWAVASQRASVLQAMLNLARCELAITPDEMDADTWALNVLNGTIDLRRGELRPHRREDLCMRIAPVEFDPKAECPLWTQFLRRIMGGAGDMIRFLQKVFGMSLTGDVSEQFLFIFYGQGANGKSTLVDTLMGMLGDYAGEAPNDMLTIKKTDDHPTEIADLCGRRLVVASETEEGGRLRIQLIKRLTGNATLKARFMRENFFTFQRTHKLILQTNNKPVVREATHAVWRRLRLVPFVVTIPDEEQDKRLLDRLRAEWQGILAWAVQGCLAWQQEGLEMPDGVIVATQDYQADSDPLAEFLEAKCRIHPNESATRHDLWQAYQAWGEAEQERYLYGRKLFYERLRKIDGVQDRQWRTGNKPERGFVGIGVVLPGSSEAPAGLFAGRKEA